MIVWIVNPYTAGDGFKLCPQILWYSFLQEVEFDSSPFECGDLVTHFQWIAYVDMTVYKFIKSIETSAFLASLTLEEDSIMAWRHIKHPVERPTWKGTEATC